jgi:hypothetical protein
MNKLPKEKRTQILTLLVEGNSLRAAARITDTAFNTVAKLFVEAGKACADYQDRTFAISNASGFNSTKSGRSFTPSKRMSPVRGPRPPMQAMYGRGLQLMPILS